MPISVRFASTKASAFSGCVKATGLDPGTLCSACVISRLFSSASSRMTIYIDGPSRSREFGRQSLSNDEKDADKIGRHRGGRYKTTIVARLGLIVELARSPPA